MANILIFLVFLSTSILSAQIQERARELGIPFEGDPGPWNAITDVPGVTVGYSTIIQDKETAVRTGVSAIFPQGKGFFSKPVFASWFSLNGNGEMTGTTWMDDSGFLESPIVVTNTYGLGIAHHVLNKWAIENKLPIPAMPVVTETWDGFLNDIEGLHVKEKHVLEALQSAKPGPIAEGNVGSGTGMICYQFKGGIGTSSRKINIDGKAYTVGVWVQTNHGLKDELLIAGVPVGKKIVSQKIWDKNKGSIVIIIATDAPLIPIQLRRVAKRAASRFSSNGKYCS